MPRTLIVSFVVSLDGYVFCENKDIDKQSIDTILVKEKNIEFAEKEICLVDEELKSLVHWLKYSEEEKDKKNIYCKDIELVQELLQKDLADEIFVFIAPVFLGRGTRILENLGKRNLDLVESTSLETGFVRLHYKMRVSRELWLEKIRHQIEFLLSISDTEGKNILNERLSQVKVERPDEFQCKMSTGSFHFFIPSAKKYSVEGTLLEKLMNLFELLDNEKLDKVDICLWRVCMENPSKLVLYNWRFMLEISPNLWAVAFDFKPQNIEQ